MYNLVTIAESLVSHPDVRQVCLEILADSISTAHAYRRWGWQISVGLSIEFSIGKDLAYRLDDKKLLLKVDIQSLSPEVWERLKQFVPEEQYQATQGIIPALLTRQIIQEMWPFLEAAQSLLPEIREKVSLFVPAKMRQSMQDILPLLSDQQILAMWPFIKVKVNRQALSLEVWEKLKQFVPEEMHQATQGIVPILLSHQEIEEPWSLIRRAYFSFIENAATTNKHVYRKSLHSAGEIIQYLRSSLNRPIIEEAGFIPPFKRIVPPDKSDGATQRTEVIKLPWKILPPGEQPFSEILKHYDELQKSNPQVRYDLDRLRRICELAPTATYVGVDEFRGYTVFYFRECLTAILDCPVWGNAIYVIKGDWKTLSGLTKAELIAGHTENVTRIVHSGDWFQRLKSCLRMSEST